MLEINLLASKVDKVAQNIMQKVGELDQMKKYMISATNDQSGL